MNLEQVFHGTPNTEFNWETQVNNRLDAEGNRIRDYNKGWYYVRKGQVYFSRGERGHFIYLELRNRIQEKANEWIMPYIMDKIKEK